MDLDDARNEGGGSATEGRPKGLPAGSSGARRPVLEFEPAVDLRTAQVVAIGTSIGTDEAETAFKRAVLSAGDWWRSGLGLRLAVQLPRAAFSREPPLDQLVERTLEQTDLPAAALQLGVVEGALSSEAPRILERLSGLGVGFSIDDFGAGRYSISELIRLPVEEVKIAPALIDELPTRDCRTLIRSTVNLAHPLGMRVATPHVDSVDTWRRLRSIGVDRAQGTVISEPLRARDVPAWLATWNDRARALRSAAAAATAA